MPAEESSFSFTNSGQASGISMGGRNNTVTGGPISASGLDVDSLQKIITLAAGLPLNKAGRADLETLRDVVVDNERGRVDGARSKLRTVGSWVSSLASSLGANLLAGQIRGD